VGYFRGRDGNVSWKAESRDPSRNLGRRSEQGRARSYGKVRRLQRAYSCTKDSAMKGCREYENVEKQCTGGCAELSRDCV
jgi:hypothetical protein